MKIVILGGGIIGVTTANELAKLGHACTIIENNSIACAASGKAGGFLAKTWCDMSSLKELANVSFSLHMDNSQKYTNVGYRNVNTSSVYVDTVKRKKLPIPHLPWVTGPVRKFGNLAKSYESAQVNPYRLCMALLEDAKKLTNGATNVILDSACGFEFVEQDGQHKVQGVKLKSGITVPADKVVIAMGAWSSLVREWLPPGVGFPHITGHRAHSIIMNAPLDLEIGAECIFLNYEDSHGVSTPEIYPRADGTLYMCGETDEKPLPATSQEVEVDKNRCTKLREIVYNVSSHMQGCQMLAEQACYLPISPDGVPIIGAVPLCPGLFIATGHSCWGILNSTATGKAMAELLTTGKATTVNLEPFNPKRFMTTGRHQ